MWRTRKRSHSPTERFDYLQKLVHEYNISDDLETKRQILANISSFGYNPVNFEPLNRLNVIPLLFRALDQNDPKLTEFAISGLSNLCVDHLNCDKIFNDNSLEIINRTLTKFSDNQQILISCLTLFVYAKNWKQNISESSWTIIENNVKLITQLNRNKRIENLVSILSSE